jgi:hypothetical protein
MNDENDKIKAMKAGPQKGDFIAPHEISDVDKCSDDLLKKRNFGICL